MNFLFHFAFIATFIILFVVSMIILRPLRIHKKRPYSTISLKVSYLVYLFIFLIMAYLLLFFSRLQATEEDSSSNGFVVYYFILIFAFLVPNLGIMLRRKIKKLRTQYNLIFTGINIAVILVLLFFIFNISRDL